MSTTSTATALAEPHPIVGDDDEITNWICILVVTCADGTLLCPTSFQQEDAVAMCKGFGLGVPQKGAAAHRNRKVLTFWSNSEVMASSHWLAVAMVWCGNPTVLCIWPLSAKQVRDYVDAGSSHPLGISVQALLDGMEFQPPPAHPTLPMSSGGP